MRVFSQQLANVATFLDGPSRDSMKLTCVAMRAAVLRAARERIAVQDITTEFVEKMADFCYFNLSPGELLQLNRHYKGGEAFPGCTIDPPVVALRGFYSTGGDPWEPALADLIVTLRCADPSKLQLADEQPPTPADGKPVQYKLVVEDDDIAVNEPFDVVSRGDDGSVVLTGTMTAYGVCDNEPWPEEFAVFKVCDDPRVAKVETMVEDVLKGKVAAEGVSWRDLEVSDALAASLNKHIDAVVETEVEDYHPGSKGVVRDIVHPALYAFVRGVSKFVPSDELREVPNPRKLRGTQGRDMWGRRYERSKYQWLPTPFVIDGDGNCKIDGYINNLDRSRHGELYTDLERLFEVFLPHFEGVVGFAHKFAAGQQANAQDDSDDMDDDMDDGMDDFGEPAKPVPRVALTGRTLQVITKIVDYELKEGHVHSGVWHVEGMSHENIIATGVYIAARTPNVEGGTLMFKRPFTRSEARYVESAGDRNRFWMQELEDILRADLVPVGHISTPAGRLLVFPNSHVHKVSDLRAVGGNGKRRIVVFWLVNPETRIVSTREVPPQQGVMSREDALAHRLALMERRKFEKQSRNVRVVELCEH